MTAGKRSCRTLPDLSIANTRSTMLLQPEEQSQYVCFVKYLIFIFIYSDPLFITPTEATNTYIQTFLFGRWDQSAVGIPL